MAATVRKAVDRISEVYGRRRRSYSHAAELLQRADILPRKERRGGHEAPPTINGEDIARLLISVATPGQPANAALETVQVMEGFRDAKGHSLVAALSEVLEEAAERGTNAEALFVLSGPELFVRIERDAYSDRDTEVQTFTTDGQPPEAGALVVQQTVLSSMALNALGRLLTQTESNPGAPTPGSENQRGHQSAASYSNPAYTAKRVITQSSAAATERPPPSTEAACLDPTG